MLLENKYYKVLRARKEGEGKAVYHVAILPDCNVYEGHFPGNPVCPGVCNIQTKSYVSRPSNNACSQPLQLQRFVQR